MTDVLNRTPEWGRMARSQLFQVEDLPGRLTISAPATTYVQSLVGLALIAAAVLLAGLILGGGFVFGLAGLIGLLAARPLIGKVKAYGDYAYKVVFLPDRVEFYGPLGRRLNVLSRDGLQQIALLDDKKPIYAHRFFADVAWATAFPLKDEPTKSLLRNNLLIAAYQQPIALDGEVWAEAA